VKASQAGKGSLPKKESPFDKVVHFEDSSEYTPEACARAAEKLRRNPLGGEPLFKRKNDG